MLRILRAGLATTLQDSGRTGWRQSGISVGGVLDLSLIHISEPTRPRFGSRMPSSA